MKDLRNYPLLSHNTFGIDARCTRFMEPVTVEEVQQACRSLNGDGQPTMIVGGGSNLLLTKDFEGNVIHPAISGIETVGESQDHILVRVGCGVVWDDFVATAVEEGWHGAENLSLIPGEAGASAVQNIGAYGAEVKDIIKEVEAVEMATGRLTVIDASECRYGYRQSRFKQDWRGRFIITHVTYRLSKTFTPQLDYGNIRSRLASQGIDTPTPRQLREAIVSIRREKLPDPAVEGNAGSFFMNPVVSRDTFCRIAAHYPSVPHYDTGDGNVKIPAGWMIEQCGWKGRSLGRAGVHSKQALVLVNCGGATGSEIVTLCDTIRRDVKEKFGIDIHPEVNII